MNPIEAKLRNDPREWNEEAADEIARLEAELLEHGQAVLDQLQKTFLHPDAMPPEWRRIYSDLQTSLARAKPCLKSP